MSRIRHINELRKTYRVLVEIPNSTNAEDVFLWMKHKCIILKNFILKNLLMQQCLNWHG
jgi:hypothetical protein